MKKADEAFFDSVSMEDIAQLDMENGFCMIPQLDTNITIEEEDGRVYAYILRSRSGIVGKNRNDVMRCLLKEDKLVSAMYDWLVDSEFRPVSVLDCVSVYEDVERHEYVKHLKDVYNVSCYYKI